MANDIQQAEQLLQMMSTLPQGQPAPPKKPTFLRNLLTDFIGTLSKDLETGAFQRSVARGTGAGTRRGGTKGAAFAEALGALSEERQAAEQLAAQQAIQNIQLQLQQAENARQEEELNLARNLDRLAAERFAFEQAQAGLRAEQEANKPRSIDQQLADLAAEQAKFLPLKNPKIEERIQGLLALKRAMSEQQDASVTAYKDFARGYPQTLEGRAKAAKDWLNLSRPPRDDSGKKFTQESRLRSDLFREIKNYPEIVDQVSRIEAGAKDPTAAGDIAILFNFMKMLDPSSVVRESEYATAASAGSLMARAQAAMNRVSNGQRLSQAQRDDFVNTARKLFQSVSPRYETIIKNYEDTARRYGLDPQNVVSGVGNTGRPGADEVTHQYNPTTGKIEPVKKP